MKHAIALALLLTSSIANAEFSIAGGADFWHDQGRPFIEIRYFGEEWRHWSAYVGNENTIGLELYTTIYGFELGMGIEHANAHTDIVDTTWAYGLRIERQFSKSDWSYGFKHRSNCRTVCDNDVMKAFRIGSDDSQNAGFNALFLRYRF
jgi:hypothetical protein